MPQWWPATFTSLIPLGWLNSGRHLKIYIVILVSFSLSLSPSQILELLHNSDNCIEAIESLERKTSFSNLPEPQPHSRSGKFGIWAWWRVLPKPPCWWCWPGWRPASGERTIGSWAPWMRMAFPSKPIGVFLKTGYLNSWMVDDLWWFIRKNPNLEMDDDWGYPYFRKPPIQGSRCLGSILRSWTMDASCCVLEVIRESFLPWPYWLATWLWTCLFQLQTVPRQASENVEHIIKTPKNPPSWSFHTNVELGKSQDFWTHPIFKSHFTDNS